MGKIGQYVDFDRELKIIMEYEGPALLVWLEYVPKSFANKVEQLEI